MSAPRAGLTRTPVGFAIVVLAAAIVVVLVAVVAINGANPRSNRRSDAYKTAVRWDLRNLVMAEELFFADSSKYAAYVQLTHRNIYSSSPGVNPPKIETGRGYWKATATHSQLPNFICGVSVGTPNPVDRRAHSGEPSCK